MTHTTKQDIGSAGTTLRQRNKSIYWAWKSMKQRCMNPRCSAYKNYGARGIKVCDDWIMFEPFCEWALLNGYEKGLDIDRINNEGDYEPSNCRWTDRRSNVNNRRKTIMFAVNGITKCRTEWEDELQIPRGTIKTWYKEHGKEYVEERLKGIIANGYVCKDYGYSHRKRIMHCESKTVFGSVKEAATYFGISSCTIVNSIRTRRSTRKGRFTYDF